MQPNGRPVSLQELLGNIIAQVGTEADKTGDPIKRLALHNAVSRLSEGLWWINASTTAGRIISVP